MNIPTEETMLKTWKRDIVQAKLISLPSIMIKKIRQLRVSFKKYLLPVVVLISAINISRFSINEVVFHFRWKSNASGGVQAQSIGEGQVQTAITLSGMPESSEIYK